MAKPMSKLNKTEHRNHRKIRATPNQIHQYSEIKTQEKNIMAVWWFRDFEKQIDG